MGDSNAAANRTRGKNGVVNSHRAAEPTSHERDIDLDLSEDHFDGQYSGTFRWKKSKKLSSLPLIQLNNTVCDLHYLNWMQYFKSRAHLAFLSAPFLSKTHTLKAVEKDLITLVHNDLAIIDCLSTPVTIAYLMEKVETSLALSQHTIPEL